MTALAPARFEKYALEAEQRLINDAGSRPRFTGFRRFAHRTSLEDVDRFVASLDNKHVHVLRGEAFIRAARCYQENQHSGAQNLE